MLASDRRGAQARSSRGAAFRSRAMKRKHQGKIVVSHPAARCLFADVVRQIVLARMAHEIASPCFDAHRVLGKRAGITGR